MSRWMNAQSGLGDWKALLFVGGAVLLAAYNLPDNVRNFNFGPRDEVAASKAAEAAAIQRDAQVRASAPPLNINPDSFPKQTYTELSSQLRAEGLHVRCYGNLKPKEKLYPSITQICWSQAKTAWDIPLENISFHFGGETLQFVRIEFPGNQWHRVKDWFEGLPGESAGTFGSDGQGHNVIGKSFATGFLMTAEPSKNSTVMVLWEAPALFASRCAADKRSLTDEQKRILCAQP